MIELIYLLFLKKIFHKLFTIRKESIYGDYLKTKMYFFFF